MFYIILIIKTTYTEHSMSKFDISVSYYGQDKVLKTDSISDFTLLLETCIHSIPSTEIVHISHLKYDGCKVDGLNDEALSKAEIISLKNHLINAESDVEIAKVLGTIHCGGESEYLDIHQLLEQELPKVKGVYISSSDIKARQMQFEDYKNSVKAEVEKNPLLTIAFDAIDWDLARSHYFAKVRMDYFANAILFIEKTS